MGDAGERVQQAGRALGRDAVILGHVACDGVGHDDGDGVVGGGHVHGGDHQADAQLTAAPAAEDAAYKVQQRVEAAVFADERAQGGDEDSDHAGLKPAGHVCADVDQKLADGGLSGGGEDGAGGKGHHCAGKDAHKQDHKHVDPSHAARQHQQVGQHQLQVVFTHDLHRCFPAGQQHHNQQRDQRSGQGNPEVAAELVLHRAALTIAGGDGGVGDKGKVVAKHRPADDGGDAQRRRVRRRTGNLDCDGREQRDGANRRAHGGGNEARHDEQNGHRKLRGDDRQHEIGHTLRAAAAHYAHKRACCQKDQQHRDDVGVAQTAAHDRELLIEGDLAVLQAGGKNRHQKRRHDGHAVKAHGDLESVFKKQAEAKIDQQKHADGEQRGGIALFHDGMPPVYKNAKTRQKLMYHFIRTNAREFH